MFVLSTNMYSFFNLSLNAVIEKGSYQRKSVCQLHVHYQYTKLLPSLNFLPNRVNLTNIF